MSEVNYSQFLGVTAFTTDASVDFMKGEAGRDAYVLTPAQHAYLKSAGVGAHLPVIVPKQVHGDVIWKVTSKDILQSGIVEADAIVTHVPGLAIAIRTADCLPALIYDPVKRVIAAVHAGWKSTRLEIARKTVELMRADYGVDPADLRVAIGPCIRWKSFEVGNEFKEYFPLETMETPDGLRFDNAGANLRQLTEAGVLKVNISDCGFDSFTDKARFHSFRRDASDSGRMLSLIVM